MNKSLFIKKDVRKVINIRNNKTTVKFKIYNPTEESKKAVFDLYEKKENLGLEDFSLNPEETRLVLNFFTDCLFSMDEINEIVENPSIYFEQIMNELEIMLSELVISYVQEKQKEVMKLKLQEAVTDMNQAIVDKIKEVDMDKIKRTLAEINNHTEVGNQNG